MKNAIILTALVPCLLMVTGCFPGPNQQVDSPGEDGAPAGFWIGLWHGFIILFSFIASFFHDGVNVYEVHNNGHLYNFGFLLGSIAFFGGGGSATRRAKRR